LLKTATIFKISVSRYKYQYWQFEISKMQSNDLNALAWFCEVVRAGSLRGAAENLGVSAATLTRRLQQLEHEAGHQLLHRSAKKFQLTLEGERYYHALDAGFAHLKEQMALLSDNGEQLRGSIRIACPESMAVDYLHDWSLQFMREHPQVDITIKFALNDHQFIEDQLDLSLVVLPPTQPRLIQKKVLDTEMWVAASPEYIATHGAPKTPQELTQFDLLTSDPQKGWLFKTEEGHFELHPTPRYVINSIRAVVDAATKSLGIVYGPKFYMVDAVERGSLTRILTDYQTEMRHVYLVHADKKLLPARVRAFKQFILERMSKVSDQSFFAKV
jgi:LysR family transcriptional regulator AphB